MLNTTKFESTLGWPHLSSILYTTEFDGTLGWPPMSR